MSSLLFDKNQSNSIVKSLEASTDTSVTDKLRPPIGILPDFLNMTLTEQEREGLLQSFNPVSAENDGSLTIEPNLMKAGVFYSIIVDEEEVLVRKTLDGKIEIYEVTQ